MGAVEVLTLSIAVLSLVASGLAAYYSYRLSSHQFRLETRSEFNRILLQINQEVIRDPSLIYYRDSRRPPDLPPLDHLHQAKLESFAHVLLNAGELLFAFYGDGRRLSSQERREWQVWQAVVVDMFQDSSLMRDMMTRHDVAAVYSKEYFDLLKTLVVQGNQAPPQPVPPNPLMAPGVNART